jgi:spermidine synthase
MRAGTLHQRIPAGEHGAAKIVHDTPDDFTRMRAMFDRQPLTAEKYTRLFVDGELWMTDAEFECQTNTGVISRASGDVLIAGLGLGLILNAILDKPSVRSVTVLERSLDVIALVGPHYQQPKLTIVEADVFTWQPSKKAYDFIYFDIWANVPNEDNKTEITTLKRRYRSALKQGGRTAVWCENYKGRW